MPLTNPDNHLKASPTLEGAKQKLKEELVSFLQAENFPVWFNGIRLPIVSNGDLTVSVKNDQNYVYFSELAQTRILSDILTDLRERFSQVAIESKKQELQEKYDDLELERLWHEEDIARPQSDRRGLEEFRQWLRERCTEIEGEKATIEEELVIIWKMMTFSPGKINHIEAGLRALLTSREIYEKPPEKVPVLKRLPVERVKGPVQVTVANLPQPPEIRAQFAKWMKMAVLGTFLAVAAGTLGYNLYQNAQRRAQEEERATQSRESCLKRHPEVYKWFGEEDAEKLTVEQIEESSEKIIFVKKYPDLEKKYAWNKLLTITFLELVWQKPEEIKNIQSIQKKIIKDWQRMCTEKKEEIIQLHFSWMEKYQKWIFSLFQRYHPSLKYADSENFWSHFYRDTLPDSVSFMMWSARGKSPIDAKDKLDVNLRIKGGDSLCVGHIGNIWEYTDRILKNGIREVQKCINEWTEGCDIIRNHKNLPNNDVITNILVSLLNKKCTLPTGRTQLELRSCSIMTQNNEIIEITLEMDVPGPEWENMAIPITFQVNAE